MNLRRVSPCGAVGLVTAIVVSMSGARAVEPTVAAPAAATAEMSLADYAQQRVGREAFGVYLAGKKAGWMTIDTRLTEHDVQPCQEEETEFLVSMQILGETSTTTTHNVARYALSGDGALLFVEEVEIDGESKVTRTGRPEGGKFKIRIAENDAVTERTTAPPKDTLQAAKDLEVWLAGPRRKGDKTTTYEVALADDAIDLVMGVEFLEAAPLVWGGVPVTAARALVDMEGGKSEMLVSPNGRLLSGTMGALMEIRAEEEDIAKALDSEPVDMLAASAILVDKPLGDGETIAKLTMELTGLKDFTFPRSPRQIAEVLGDGKMRVTTRLESEPSKSYPITPSQRNHLLRATPSVQTDRKEIRELAAEIVGDETDPVAIARLIVDWLTANLEPTYAANASTATAVLERRAGDCTEHALLFTALARAAGVPARQVGGVVYANEPKPMFAWHAWAEIHDGRGWISVDPLWKQVRVDPTHIQFSIDDGGDSAWMNVLGAVKLKVIDIERVAE